MGIAFIALLFIEIIIFLLVTLFKSAKEIKRNDELVDCSLDKVPEGCKSLENVFLSFDDKIIKVEKILVSKKGIFVILTKDYEGWVFGKEDERDWVQLAYNKKKKFYNPVWENNIYVDAVRRKIPNMKHVPIYSVILFEDECNLKKIESITPVMNCWELRRYVVNLKNGITLSDEEVENIMISLGRDPEKMSRYNTSDRNI